MKLMRMATRGAIAGIVATVAMDAVWYQRYRAGGGDRSFTDWEFSAATVGFDDAPAPAKVGKLVADSVGVDLPPESAGTVNNVVHWATGIGWGKAAGLVAGALPVSPIATGVVTGVGAWGTSYALLGKVGIYEPITSYDKATLWKDLSAHLVFGSVLGLALAAGRILRP